MSVQNFPMDFATMYGEVLDKGRLEDTDDLERVKRWINQSYAELCLETNFLENVDSTTPPLVADQRNVQIPADIIKIEYVTPLGMDGNLWGPMRLVPLQEILQVRAYNGGQVNTGAPERYAFRSSQIPIIEFWPTASGGEQLTFYGLGLPPALEADGDLPVFPEPYAQAICFGALVHACEFKKDLLMMQQMEQEYADWKSRLQGLTNERSGYIVQQFAIQGRRGWPHDNSVDQGW
jgi:hypothetical protein